MGEEVKEDTPNRSVNFDEKRGRIAIKEGGVEVGQLKLAFTDSNNAVIVDVGVPGKHQRQGIGRRLTWEAERIAREKGAARIGAIAQPDYLELLKGMGYAASGFFVTKDLTSEED